MERLSDIAIEVINNLHTERLEYNSEYIPLIDAAHLLSAYEDTGLTPEEYQRHVEAIRRLDIEHIHDLLQAEKDGRLMMLPCKVGDSVYFLIPDDMVRNGIYLSEPYRVVEAGSRGFWTSGLNDKPDEMDDFTPWTELGETAFLTREETEAALKGGRE